MLPARVVGPLAVILGGLFVVAVKKKFLAKRKSPADKAKDIASKLADKLKSV